jgi:hypothetical protein
MCQSEKPAKFPITDAVRTSRVLKKGGRICAL